MLGINMRETFENASDVANNNLGNEQKNNAKNKLTMSIAVVVVYLILMLFVGPWLWNNVLKLILLLVSSNGTILSYLLSLLV